jgi:hypothetical protein
MGSDSSGILNPVGVVHRQADSGATAEYPRGAKRVIALLNNGKPNVDHFLQAVEDDLRRGGACEVVNVRKPRSAAPIPDLHALATRCDFVINAVAD